MQLNPAGLRAPPDALNGFTLPQPFGERWAVVGRVPIGADHTDCAYGVHLSDAGRGRIGRHSTADDQVLVVCHQEPPIGATVRAVEPLGTAQKSPLRLEWHEGTVPNNWWKAGTRRGDSTHCPMDVSLQIHTPGRSAA